GGRTHLVSPAMAAAAAVAGHFTDVRELSVDHNVSSDHNDRDSHRDSHRDTGDSLITRSA
ncbi:MAG: hypothetical protein AAF671_02955, partial [Pseudomonadota bacterium]